VSALQTLSIQYPQYPELNDMKCQYMRLYEEDCLDLCVDESLDRTCGTMYRSDNILGRLLPFYTEVTTLFVKVVTYK